MADAGPHGLGEGHEQPNGDPDGKCPLALAKEAESLGITVYSMVVGNFASQKTKWFFSAMSAITGGQAMSLTSANLLADAILAGARENIDMERGISTLRNHIAALEAKAGQKLTAAQRAAESERLLAAGTNSKLKLATRGLPADKLLTAPAARVAQAKSAANLQELRALWDKPVGVDAGTDTGTGGASSTVTRIARMSAARDARSTDKVEIECYAQGSKVRARVISAGYDRSKNCQFPRAIRAVGKKFVVDTVVDAGSFYRVKGSITPCYS